MVADQGNGHKDRRSAEDLIADLKRQAAEEQARQQQAQGNGGGAGYGGGGEFTIFGEVMIRQVDRRIELLRKAAKLDADAAERGVGAEEIEEELEKAPLGAPA
jgi:hypothetical protein